MQSVRFASLMLLFGGLTTPMVRSVAAQQNAAPATATVAPVLPPATKLEGFKPTAGDVVTLGYNDLGDVSGVSVDVREMRGTQGATVRGLLVEVKESEYREERSFVDADEVPELIKGLDALQAVTANPTGFKNFEVRYTTRGELCLTAYNTRDNKIQYAVQAGRTLKAERLGLDEGDMKKLRELFQAALDKLNAPGNSH